jgi:hypothetical protein
VRVPQGVEDPRRGQTSLHYLTEHYPSSCVVPLRRNGGSLSGQMTGRGQSRDV